MAKCMVMLIRPHDSTGTHFYLCSAMLYRSGNSDAMTHMAREFPLQCGNFVSCYTLVTLLS